MKDFLIKKRHMLHVLKNPYKERSGSSPTESSSIMKFLRFSLYFGTSLACLDPDFQSRSGPKHLYEF
jgi:hypothetical protein